MIDAGVVQRLVEIGDDIERGVPVCAQDFKDLVDQDEINRRGPQDWEVVTANLSVPQIVSLAKALTIVERELKWCGGSVAAAIWVFRELSRRIEPEERRDVADWMLSQTKNDWVPFGSATSARSMQEYERPRSANEKARARAEAGARRQEADKARHAQRVIEDSRRAHQHRAATLEHNAERRATLAELSLLSRAEQLMRVSQDDTHPVDYYPEELARTEPDVLLEMNSQTRKALVERIGERRKGPWKRLRDALQHLDSSDS